MTNVSTEAAIDPNKAGSRQAQVLDAAVRCFCRYGFHGTSIQRISAAAGMSPGHIYHYFSNKEAIVEGIVNRYLAELLELSQRIGEAMPAAGVARAFSDHLDAAIGLRMCSARANLVLEILAEGARNIRIGEMLKKAEGHLMDKTLPLLAASPRLATVPQEALRARLSVIHSLLDGLTVRSILDPSMDMALVSPIIVDLVRTILGEASGQAALQQECRS